MARIQSATTFTTGISAQTSANQHVLEWEDVLEKALVFARRAEAHNVFDAGPIVPATVEQYHFMGSRQIRNVALKVPGIPFSVGRHAERNNAGLARTEVLDNPLDRAILPARIPAFKYDDDFVTVLDHMPLHL